MYMANFSCSALAKGLIIVFQSQAMLERAKGILVAHFDASFKGMFY